MSKAKNIGAFFDLDGTLMPAPSLEQRFVVYLASRHEITVTAAGGWLWHAAGAFLRGARAAIEGNKFYLAGLRGQHISNWIDSLAHRPIPFFQDGLERIAWHSTEGHRVVVVSGTLAPLARAITARFPFAVDVIATELEVCAGRWTGHVAGPHMSGSEKSRAVAAYAERHELHLDQSYGYGNEISDLPMLETVGRPTAVNPSPHLERVARLRGWRVCDWKAKARALHECARELAPEEVR